MPMIFNRKLPIPQLVKEEYPISEHIRETKQKLDKEIADIFTGTDSRLLLIIGPCSADREDAVLDYVGRLARIQEEVRDKILIIPRIYTNKPRTTGDGYKGMLHQPDPDKAPDPYEGIIATRRLHTKAIEETGLVCADEMLYPEDYRYLSDLLSYVSIGARSVENQQHRLVASGIEVPVGMKNPTSGDIGVMLNSINAAQHGHSFIYRGWDVNTTGNPLAHAILRGYVDRQGRSVPNYHYDDLNLLYEEYEKRDLQNPAVIVDTNHSNSDKQYLEQINIAKEILRSMKSSSNLRKLVKGLMTESYIEDGAQKIGEGVYGKSITDPCLGWDKTKQLILELADEL